MRWRAYNPRPDRSSASISARAGVQVGSQEATNRSGPSLSLLVSSRCELTMSGGGGHAVPAADRPHSTNTLRIKKREARKRERHGHLVRNEEFDRAHGSDCRLL